MTDRPIRADYRPHMPERRPHRHLGRRLALLALAMAVPAMAAPGGWTDAAPDKPAPPRPMGFEIPGESFPGSAFYYLDEQPYLPHTEGTQVTDTAGLGLRTPTGSFETIQIAGPLRFKGSAVDRMRAQQCLTMAIYYEAANEPDAGQRAVAQVVLNRVANANFPDTVCGVVFEGSERTTGCQFSFTCDGSLNRKPMREWWDRAAKVARAALAGVVYAPVGLATHYHTVQVHPYWADSLDNVGTIGAHRFYRWRGSAGERAAFGKSYRGGEPLAAPHPRIIAAGPAPVDPIVPAGLIAPPASMLEIVGNATQPAIMPASGQVREEYARSGQWLRQP